MHLNMHTIHKTYEGQFSFVRRRGGSAAHAAPVYAVFWKRKVRLHEIANRLALPSVNVSIIRIILLF